MTWIAYYNNTESLPQFNPDGSENLFSLINQDELVRFDIHSDTGDSLSVDFNFGTITLNDNVMCFDGTSGEDFRLIYYRRVYIHTDMGSNVQRKESYEHAGWQFTDKEGKNRKMIYGLFNEFIDVIYK